MFIYIYIYKFNYENKTQGKNILDACLKTLRIFCLQAGNLSFFLTRISYKNAFYVEISQGTLKMMDFKSFPSQGFFFCPKLLVGLSFGV